MTLDANILVPAIAAIVVAIIETMAIKDRKRAERRGKTREKESLLSMQMMSASVELGIATAMAVEGQKINGEMRRAKESANKAQTDYNAFLQEVAARQVAKT